MFRIRHMGMRQLQDSLSDGLEAVGDRVLSGSISRAPVETGALRESLHTNKEHSREWPKPAVFVATASGDGFFIHEGTTDTPPHHFLTDSLDATMPQVSLIMRSKAKRGIFG